MTISTLKVKRLAAAVLILLFMSLAVFGRAQSSYSIDVKDTPLGAALKLIQKRTGYNFVYFQEDVQQYKTSFSVHNASIDEVMNACLRDMPIEFSIDSKIVSLHLKRAVPEAMPAPGDRMVNISGRISNDKGEPLAGANITVQGKPVGTSADEKGDFKLENISADASLVISYIGYLEEVVHLKGRTKFDIILRRQISNLEDVNVSYSNGFQFIPKDRATGSFAYVDNALLNRSVSSDILSRFNGVVSGMLNENTQPGLLGATSSAEGIYIRGLSTINSSTTPLVVIDNFPYDGDLSNINPNDVESVTILKDAAAASIWGVRAGNGVIVITTKKGVRNHPAHISINTNVTLTDKPNLFYAKSMISSDYIDLETSLYNSGFYDNIITSPSEQGLDPVLETLMQETNGQITAYQAQQQINNFRGLDIRNDASKYLFQKDLSQQYSLSVSGGGQDDQYFVSGGFDNLGGNGTFLKRNASRRISVDASNVISLFGHRLDFSSSIYYINNNAINDGMGQVNMPIAYPYAQLADTHGNFLAIPQLRPEYTDTAGAGLLQNWNYIPLEELDAADNTTNENEYRVDIGFRYKLPLHFFAEIKYQYGSLKTDGRDLLGLQTFYTRNLINSFSEINWATGSVIYPVPLGSILKIFSNSFIYQNFRPQISYSNSWGGQNQLTAIAGSEVRSEDNVGYATTYYGYDDTHATFTPVDEFNQYPNYITGSGMVIPSGQNITSTTNRFLSYFANAAYTYMGRYMISASGRNDGSNLFGVNTNQKHVPLWSAGLGWELSKESFYHISWLSLLKLRATYGYQGNLASNLSALLTTVYTGTNNYGALQSNIVNPPNPDLRWERTAQGNLGVDFSTRDDRLSGSFEYYLKKGIDLIGPEPLAPSSGLPSFLGNAADMKGRGFDLVINSKNILGAFNWSTNFILSYNTDKVTEYGATDNTNGSFIANGGITPVVGKPVHAIFAYPWAGLDSTGNPRGYLNGKMSEDYSDIESLSDLSQLKYIGHAFPQFFGSIRNDIVYKQFGLSFNIIYKLDYYFRRTSINYYSLYNFGYFYGTDYRNRWQKPGDELRTNVPSMIYPANVSRDNFYLGAQPLVDRGDEIRLQDIRVSYSLSHKQLRRLPVESIDLYFYANNLGLLWRANHDRIDPDVVPSSGNYNIFPFPKSYSFGVKIEL